MNHRYPEGMQLRVPASAHVHAYSKLSPSLQTRVEETGQAHLPIVHNGATYFPKSFGVQDLIEAFHSINRGNGWTIERRGKNQSFVGECYEGSYKVRLALHPNEASPDLITAYPVSRTDRRHHSDFLALEEPQCADLQHNQTSMHSFLGNGSYHATA